ncbi:prolipoprotein diacylglyceryl transferase [Luteimonas panaciterrae]|jgi:phosphatidylglycerol:prolipoprotein diacylglycerol transferase|uniref:prolipoprotein diacylglyceryl transferase n=1 Tax=Luteimonas panaciterrae TaxID=363885 RepID=UPI001CFB4592|nr:prolipoprotein diacylglyceryl transferase [Luteimonas panaciterrae]
MLYLHQIDPIAFRIGPVAVHWYGLMYLLGFVAAWYLGRSRVRAGRLPGVDANAYGDLMFYAMLGVVLGGRIGYILFYDLRTYIEHPLQVFKIWQGGMSFHGGLLGVVVAMFWWGRRHKLHFFDVADFVAPLVPPGLGFGRLGNFINGELWGKATGGNWGVVFPQDPEVSRLILDPTMLRAQFESGALNMYARHPSQLYQFALEGVAMFVILWWYSSRPRPRYAISGLFALLYGVFRFAVEFVRLPDENLGYLAFGWLTMGQLLSVPLILIGLFWLWKSHRAPTLQPQPPAAAEKA